MTDYWLNKLVFDLGHAGGPRIWTDGDMRAAFINAYPLSAKIRQALIDDDYATLQPLINAYLMRNFLLFCGLSDDETKSVLHALHDGPQPGQRAEGTAHG